MRLQNRFTRPSCSLSTPHFLFPCVIHCNQIVDVLIYLLPFLFVLSISQYLSLCPLCYQYSHQNTLSLWYSLYSLWPDFCSLSLLDTLSSFLGFFYSLFTVLCLSFHRSSIIYSLFSIFLANILLSSILLISVSLLYCTSLLSSILCSLSPFPSMSFHPLFTVLWVSFFVLLFYVL